MNDQQENTDITAMAVQEVMRTLEDVFDNNQVDDLFEIEDPDLAEGMKRFQKLYETDREAALAGMLVACVVTADLFEDILSQLGQGPTGEEDGESE